MLRISLLTFHHLVRTVLLMYVLTLGVAMASPLMKPDAMNLICTSTGYKLVGTSTDADQGRSSAQTHLLDCPLCVATTLPVVLASDSIFEPPHALSYATQSIPAARLAATVSAPLPARGPPSI